MGIWMVVVEEFDNMEAALIDIKVNVSGLKIRRAGFPDPCFRIEAFYFLPSCVADALAVGVRQNKQQIQVVMLCLFIDIQNDTSDTPAILADAIGDSFVNAFLNCLAGDYTAA